MKIKYYCDDQRHLICEPYSIENLHKMAEDLKIKQCWFHKNHYDMPKRRIKELTNKCTVISSKEIINKINEIEFSTEEYFAKLPMAYRIYDILYPNKPKSNQEWAEGFNIRGKIIKELLKDK